METNWWSPQFYAFTSIAKLHLLLSACISISIKCATLNNLMSFSWCLVCRKIKAEIDFVSYKFTNGIVSQVHAASELWCQFPDEPDRPIGADSSQGIRSRDVVYVQRIGVLLVSQENIRNPQSLCKNKTGNEQLGKMRFLMFRQTFINKQRGYCCAFLTKSESPCSRFIWTAPTHARSHCTSNQFVDKPVISLVSRVIASLPELSSGLKARFLSIHLSLR